MSSPIRIILAFPDNLLGELVVRTLNDCPGFCIVDHFSSSKDLSYVPLPTDIRVALIAVDFPNRPRVGLELLHRFREESPATRCVLVVDDISKEDTVAGFAGGARGVLCTSACDSYHLCHCVSQVSAGQIWASTLQVGWILEALSSGLRSQSQALRAINRYGEGFLSGRERQILRLLASGSTNRQIAAALDLSEHTVKNYVFRIFEKAGVSSRTELMAEALRRAVDAPAAAPFHSLPASGLRLIEKRPSERKPKNTKAGSGPKNAGNGWEER